jgi:hypothetical protein
LPACRFVHVGKRPSRHIFGRPPQITRVILPALHFAFTGDALLSSSCPGKERCYMNRLYFGRFREMCYEGESTKVEFTPEQQEVVNRIAAEEKRLASTKAKADFERQSRELQLKLEEVSQRAELTAEERQNLEAFQARFQSAEERASKAEALSKKREAEYVERLAASDKRYRDYRTTAELATAASDGGAYSTEQLLAVLGPKATIIDVVNKDGKPSGETKVVVTLRAKDELGAEVDTQMTPKDAVAHLKTQEAYFNLFKSNVAGGAGSYNGIAGLAGAMTGPSGQLDVRKMLSSPEGTQEYMRLREAARKGDVVAQQRLGLKPNQR